MKRAAKWLLRAYPSNWRRRYGGEVEALIEDTGLGWRGSLDLLKGAIVMRTVRWQVIVGVSALLGAFAGFGISFLLPPVYVSRASIAVIPGDGAAARHSALAAVQNALRRGPLTDVIRTEALYPGDHFKRPMEDIVETMRRDIRVTTLPSGGWVEVSFAYEDRTKARAAAQLLVARIMREHASASAAPLASSVKLELIEPPSLPQRSVNPHVAEGAIGGLAAGLLLGSFIARVRRLHAVA